MHECSKAVMRRLSDSAFITKYLVGDGIDIAGEPDSLALYAELFPAIRSLRVFDSRQEDAQALGTIADESYDFVHNGNCLVRMEDPAEALRSWFRVLRPGGHLVFTVPDEDLYEQGVFPSTNNPHHRWTATIYKQRSWSPRSINLLDLLTG